MAVVMYKDGGCVRIEPEFIDNHLALGYSLQNPDKPLPEIIEEYEEIKEKQEDMIEAAEELDDDKEAYFRQKAKELGIRNYHNMKIDNLIPKIEASLAEIENGSED